MIELSNFQWQDLLTALSFIFGMVSLIAYIEQRRSSRDQSKVLKFINRQLDRDISLEEIEDLEHKKEALSDDIHIKLPNLAQVSILNNQLDFHRERLQNNIRAIREIEGKLTEIDATHSFDNIDNNIKKYLSITTINHKKKEILLSQSQHIVIVLIAAIVAMGIILPNSIAYYIKLILAIYLITQIIKYMYLIPKDEDQRAKLNKLINSCINIFALLFLSFIIIIIARNWSEDYRDNNSEKWVAASIIMVGLLAILSIKLLVKIYYKKVKSLFN